MSDSKRVSSADMLAAVHVLPLIELEFSKVSLSDII